MCVVIPARVTRIDGDSAWVQTGASESRASLTAVEGVQVGDYVACHAGLVLERLEPAEAEALLNVLAAMEELP